MELGGWGGGRRNLQDLIYNLKSPGKISGVIKAIGPPGVSQAAV